MSILMRARDDETSTEMTRRQLRDEATLVIAGSETTGNTRAWACYLAKQRNFRHGGRPPRGTRCGR